MLVFAVTRVIWIPSGEFVAYGTLTLAGFQLGKSPGIVGLLVGMAVVAGAMEVFACVRRGEPGRIATAGRTLDGDSDGDRRARVVARGADSLRSGRRFS